MADKINVSRQTISRWETSQTAPDLASLEKLCQFYQLSYDELITQHKSKKEQLNTQPYILIIFGVFIMMIIGSFLFRGQHENTGTSIIVLTPADICLVIGGLGTLISCILLYKNHRK